MSKKFHLDIITPNGTFSLDNVEHLRAPSTDGLFGVLANHIPSIIAIGNGEIQIKISGKNNLYATSGGYADIKKESVSLVLETAEEASSIDLERSEKALSRAKEYLKDSSNDLVRAKESIERAKIRIAVAKKFN
tara:strand:+ start:130 stop:531 length:402 start_codon:yes stop_codon:yes gene_type:complete